MEEDDGRIPWVNEEALADKHNEIFHYTNFINLRSILESSGLFATPYSATNDRDEFRAAAEILCPKIYEFSSKELPRRHPRFFRHIFAQGGNPDEILQKDSRTFYNAGLKTNAFKPHLTCFSYHSTNNQKKNGLLTMWRSYAGSDGGIAIGFDFKRLLDQTYQLQKAYKFPAIYFDQALYGAEDEELRRRFEDAEDLISMYVDFLDAKLANREPTLHPFALRKLLVLSACTKHEDFSDEREIRLISSEPDPGEESKVSRVGNKMLIEIAGCISSILIGPSRDQSAIEAAIRHTLTAANRNDVSIACSETPYRSF